MSEGILEQLAYGGGSTWRDLLQGAEPQNDGNGMLAPPWGDAIRLAKRIELSDPNWNSNPAYAEQGPAGQVIDLLKQLGHDPWIQFAERTEQSAGNGDTGLRGGSGGNSFEVEQSGPQQQIMGGGGYQSRALNALMGVPNVEIQEKANLLEVATALLGAEIEMANRYNILDHQGNQMMFAIEQTDCITRQMKQCFPDCAPWSVDILYTQNGSEEKAFSMTRDLTFTCCCFNRPVVTITEANSGQVIGSLSDPFACLDLTFTMRGPQEQEVLKGNGGCCQWGLCCPLPCGPCSEVDFPITDAQSGAEVGHIQKTVPSCCKFLFASDVDNYKVEFGAVQNSEYKLLMIAMAIFIDFRYFNDSSNDEPAPDS